MPIWSSICDSFVLSERVFYITVKHAVLPICKYKLDAQASAFSGEGMHLLAPRACIENALYVEFLGEIQKELIGMIKTVQHSSVPTGSIMD